MRRDLTMIKPLQSSFLSCEKDTELLLKTLFIDTKPYSNTLKKLLVVEEPDCLDKTIENYQKVAESYSVRQLIQEGYVRTSPRVKFDENNKVQSFIIITFDNFSQNSQNEQFKDCTVNFDIICNIDAWNLEDYKIRPLQICGYIDGIFNLYNKQDRLKPNGGLTGIGEYIFLGCNQLILDEHLAGYTISYRAVHFTEDKADVE